MGQAQVDGRGIPSVHGRINVDGRRISGVQQSGLFDQDLGEVGEYPPVALFGSVADGRSRKRCCAYCGFEGVAGRTHTPAWQMPLDKLFREIPLRIPM